MYKKLTREDYIRISIKLGNGVPEEDVLDFVLHIEDKKEAAWKEGWAKGFDAGVKMSASQAESVKQG